MTENQEKPAEIENPKDPEDSPNVEPSVAGDYIDTSLQVGISQSPGEVNDEEET